MSKTNPPSKFKAYQNAYGHLTIVQDGYGYIEMDKDDQEDCIVFIGISRHYEYENAQEIPLNENAQEIPLKEAVALFQARADNGFWWDDYDIDKAKAFFQAVKEELTRGEKTDLLPEGYEIEEKTIFVLRRDGKVLIEQETKQRVVEFAHAVDMSEKINRVAKKTNLSLKTIEKVLKALAKEEV